MAGEARPPRIQSIRPAARDKPRYGITVETFEIFPHARVDRVPLNPNDFLEVRPSDDDGNRGDVHDDVTVEQTLVHVRTYGFKGPQDDLFFVHRARIASPDDAQFDFASKYRILEMSGQFRGDEMPRFDVFFALEVVEDLHRTVELRRAAQLFELNACEPELMKADDHRDGDYHPGNHGSDRRDCGPVDHVVFAPGESLLRRLGDSLHCHVDKS